MGLDVLVSRKAIVRWLEDFEYLASGTRSPDAPAGGSAPQSRDGVTGSRLNKIMLEDALAKLGPRMRACLMAKYVHNLTEKQAAGALGIGVGSYKRLCKEGIDTLYYEINGTKANAMDLLNKIKNA